MTLNLYGTQNVIGLCRGMKRLEVRIFRFFRWAVFFRIDSRENQSKETRMRLNSQMLGYSQNNKKKVANVSFFFNFYFFRMHNILHLSVMCVGYFV